MKAGTEQCAREVLETVPMVMRFIRGCVRQHPVEGLLVPQFRTLSFVNRTHVPSLSAVAEHLGISMPAMSRLMNGLVNRGWVKRRPIPDNRRQVALELTDLGRAKLETLRRAIRLQVSDRLVPLSVSERRTISQAMRSLRVVFENGPLGKTNRKTK